MRREDTGALAPAVPVLVLVLFLLAGLVVDSARQLDARSRAVAYAEEAARAGAARIRLDLEAAVLDVAAAEQAVVRYCASVRAADAAVAECGTTSATPDRIAVRVRLSTPASLLAAAGLQTLTATGEGEAIAQQGVTGVDEYPDLPPPSVTLTQVPLPVEVGDPEPDPTMTDDPTPPGGTPPGTATGPPTGSPPQSPPESPPESPPQSPPGPPATGPTTGPTGTSTGVPPDGPAGSP